MRQRIIAGSTLIVLGLGLFVIERIDGIGEAGIFFLVGGIFLASYLYSRAYGLLIPAGILLGLGAGELADRWLFDYGDARMIGLGCGFVSVFVIALAYQRRSHWWPLIPGVALILAGIPHTEEIVRYVIRNWPLILVLIGVMILLGAFGRPSRGRSKA